MLSYISIDNVKRIISHVNVFKRNDIKLKQVSIIATTEEGREVHILLMGNSIENIEISNAGITECQVH